MLEYMAVKHERCLATGGLIEAGEYLGLARYHHGVFPTGVLESRRAAILGHNPEAYAVDMKRMRDHGAADLSAFHGSPGDLEFDLVHVEGTSIDRKTTASHHHAAHAHVERYLPC